MKRFLTFVFTLLSACTLGQRGPAEEIHSLLDNWHKAAADNDQQAYFDALDDESVYIGTDSSEIWTRQQFYDWSTPYFNERKGWAFSKMSRNVYFSDDGKIAWFDELLKYGKGTLRGSGVLLKRGHDWRIVHYVLSVPIPNDKYKEVMTLIHTRPMLHDDPQE